MSQPVNERRFDRGAWLTLLLTLGLLFLVTATVVYRFQLPTDGWLSSEPEELNSVGFIYQSNVMGAPSGLQPGDHLIQVEGVRLSAGGVDSALWSLQDTWQAGNVVRYTVQRGDQVLDLDVPLVHRDFALYGDALDIAVSDLIGMTGIIVFLGVALLAFWRSPTNPAARALWVLAAVIAVSFMTLNVLPATIADNVDPVAMLALLILVGATFSILWPPAFIRFALVFPKPSPLLEKWPWLNLAPYVIGLLALVAFIKELYLVTWGWTAASVLIAVAILIYNAIVSRDAVSRAQLRWGLGGMVVGLLLFFLSAYLGLFMDVPDSVQVVLDPLGALSFGIMGVTLAIAVTRYRLFDIDVIIRRTTSYAILSGILLLVYFGSIVVLQRLLSPLTGESTVAVVLSTLLIAALFLPLRRRVQDAIDRRFFRRKYDAEQVMAQFAATVRDETDLDALTAELVRVIQETMQPEFVSVWLKPAQSGAVEVAAAGQNSPQANGMGGQ